jgi:transcriptional regulator with GAF, ATPase, and Fis domain
VPVNCAAIPENLIESELFGHEKGAFTGAYTTQPGKFEQAKQGIIFLDEIGELAKNLQMRLLRVLEERSFTRVGGNRSIEVDVMVISATNKNIQHLLNKGEFREDLFYRLNVVKINIPPLRERKEDITPLAEFFLEKYNRERKKNFSLAPEALRLLESYDFPGNVRELRNIVEDAFVFGEDNQIRAQDLSLNKSTMKVKDPSGSYSPMPPEGNFTDMFPTYRQAFEQFEKNYFFNLMETSHWNITEAGGKANLTREWIGKKIKKLDLNKTKIPNIKKNCAL